MRIGIVLPNVPNYTETFLVSKIENLVKAGHEVTAFVTNKRDSFHLCKVVQAPDLPFSVFLRVPVVLVYLLGLSLSTPLKTWRFLRLERRDGNRWVNALVHLYLSGFILRHELDWVHFGFLTMAVNRENVARAMGARMSASLRGYDISRFPLRNRSVYSTAWRKLDKIHTISDALLQKAHRLGMRSETSFQRIPPAIDTTNFTSTRNRSLLGTPVKILTVGRLHWVKGMEYVLEAFSRLLDQGQEFQYTVVGDGADRDRLVFAAHQFGLSGVVHFVGKKLPQEVKTLMELNDIYVQYSVQEGFCNAVLEAQSMRLLCVVSDAEGLPENVLHKETGWVVPRRNPTALANQLLELISASPEALNRIRNQARDRVVREFNISSQSRLFKTFYDQGA